MKNIKPIFIILIVVGVMFFMNQKTTTMSLLKIPFEKAQCETERSAHPSYLCVKECVEVTQARADCLSGIGLPNYQNYIGKWFFGYYDDKTCTDLLVLADYQFGCLYGPPYAVYNKCNTLFSDIFTKANDWKSSPDDFNKRKAVNDAITAWANIC